MPDIDVVDFVRVDIDAGYLVSKFRQACAGHAPDIAQTDDDNALRQSVRLDVHFPGPPLVWLIKSRQIRNGFVPGNPLPGVGAALDGSQLLQPAGDDKRPGELLFRQLSAV